MTPLPTPEKLAEMVTTVTMTMFGLRFTPESEPPPSASATWRTATLPIPGRTPITVGLSSDESGCTALGSAMFACKPTEVDSTMMDDSLCELVNMTAGLVKSAMSLDQALGLPRLSSAQDGVRLRPPVENERTVLLKADRVGMVLWVCEGVTP